MSSIQPVLTATELALLDHMAQLTGAERTDVVKNALAVYQWFVRQAITGAQVVARKPTGEEVSMETIELAALTGKGNLLTPEELGRLANQLADTEDPVEAEQIRERITRGFYGI